MRSQGDASSAKKELDELSGLHELRTRLAQSKLLIVQGVDALKQQKLDQALSLFQKSADLTPDLPIKLITISGLRGKKKRSSAR